MEFRRFRAVSRKYAVSKSHSVRWRTEKVLVAAETAPIGKPCRINPKRIEIMNTKLAATCLIAGLMLVPVAGYTADSAPTTYVKDSVITTKVKAELAAEKMDKIGRAHV